MSVRVAGHFGEWLQGRLGADGPVALVTLACPALGVRATITPAELSLTQSAPVMDLARLRSFLHHLGQDETGAVSLDIEMPLGGGAGASTASLVAIGRALGCDTDLIARACVATEGASDPVMFDQPDTILWAPRVGQVIAPMAAVPACDIVGGFWGAHQRTDPSDVNFPDIGDLVRAWGLADRLDGFAALATESAERTRMLRGPYDDPMLHLAKDLGALGYARAHTGSARGLIFAPGSGVQAETALREAGLSGVLRFQTGGQT